MKSISRVSTIALALFLPVAASASSVVGGVDSNGNWFLGFGSGSGSGIGACSGTICGVASTILYLINSVAVPLLFAIAFIVFLYGVAKAYIFSGGDEAGVAKGHRLILWGIIGFVVMISLWGLVNVVATTFNLGGYAAPLPPTSY